MTKRILTPQQKADKLEYQRKWRAENPDRVKEASRRHYDRVKGDPEFQAENRARVLAWQKANAESVNEKNKAWRLANHERELQKEQEYREANRPKLREYSRLRQRRLSGVANATAEARTGRCENPGCTYEGVLVWDHCHGDKARVGEPVFRGWLCDCCNRGIGYLQDDPERMRGAAVYIQKFLDRLAAAG